MNGGNDNENMKKGVAGSSLELANQPSWRKDYARLSFHILPSPPVTESVKWNGQGFDKIRGSLYRHQTPRTANSDQRIRS